MRHPGLIWVVLSIATLLFTPPFPAQAEAKADADLIAISVADAVEFIQQDKGRVVTVLLYASWCPSCRNFFPDFLQLAGRYLGREVDVLAFSVDDTREEILAYLRDYDLIIVPMWLLPRR